MRKPQSEHDAKWLIIQTRLKPDHGADLDEMRRAEPSLPSRAQMMRILFERERAKFLKKRSK